MIIRDWNALADSERRVALRRPLPASDENQQETVQAIIASVRADGDAALRELTARYDGCVLDDFLVSEDEFSSAESALDPQLGAAMDEAIGRLQQFHEAAMPRAVRVETAPGVVCERILRPIDRIGLYVPAGSAPLPSTVLMLGVPARLAGCPNVVLCTPPGRDGRCDPAILVAARRVGIGRVIKVGGAQAIAALAYGTASVPKCDKIFGPGNAYVTAAKLCVAQDPDGTAIDLPAGPSEVLIVADAAANPEFVAADLLAQAEHGADSQALLLSDSAELLRRVANEIDAQLQSLPRRCIAAAVLNRCCLIQVASLDQALAISNDYAPEHLILQVSEPRRWLLQVRSAGSVFLGAYAPETLGDYCSGTNHVLPTGGFARVYSGLSVASFLKQITVQEVSSAGLRRIGPCAVAMASAEGLAGHGRAVTLRLATLAKAAA